MPRKGCFGTRKCWGSITGNVVLAKLLFVGEKVEISLYQKGVDFGT